MNMTARIIRKNWWVDFRHNGFRYRKKSPDNSKSGAQAYEALLRRKLSEGEDINDKPKEKEAMALYKDYGWEWFNVYVKNNNKFSEIRTKEFILRKHLIPFFGKTPIDKITTMQIEQYKSQKMKTSLVNKSINNHLHVLSKSLRTAEEWGLIESLPKIKLLKTPPQEFDFLTIAESEKLLEHAKGVWHDMILTALKTGLRFGELKALNWKDIDWERRMIIVRSTIYRNVINSTKSNKKRYVPMTREVYNALMARKREKGFIFTDNSERPLKDTVCQNHLDEACERANLRRITWHVLRHTFASHLASSGASMKAIQELLGHADIQTTLRYAHLSPSTLKDTVNLLEKKDENENFGQHVGNRQKKFAQIINSITS